MSDGFEKTTMYTLEQAKKMGGKPKGFDALWTNGEGGGFWMKGYGFIPWQRAESEIQRACRPADRQTGLLTGPLKWPACRPAGKQSGQKLRKEKHEQS